MIPTAEEFLKGDENNEPWTGTQEQALIEFTKLHVEAALKAAAEKAQITYTQEKTWDFTEVDKDSILNSYPLTNIK